MVFATIVFVMVSYKEDALRKLMNRQVQLVDEHDAEIGVTDVVTAHLGDGLLHRAISVFLFRIDNGVVELLMQRRSTEKLVGAEQWANTVCGNVEPGQSYLECAKKRLAYELDIHDVENLTDVYTLIYQTKCSDLYSENEVDHIFTGWYFGTAAPNEKEVSAVQWVPWTEVSDAVNLDASFAPWFTLMSSDRALRQRITNWLRLEQSSSVRKN